MGTTYDLVSLINHSGGLSGEFFILICKLCLNVAITFDLAEHCIGGHYIAYAHNETSNQWFEFDDGETNEVSEDTVKNTEARRSVAFDGTICH